jgi:hypothetical protein
MKRRNTEVNLDFDAFFRWRKQHSLSAVQAAQLLGKTTRHISNLDRGVHRPSICILKVMNAHARGIVLDPWPA